MLGDQALVLRPSFTALVAAEEELGPLFQLVDWAASGDLSLTQIVALFWHCMTPPRPEWTREALGDVVLEAGLAQAMPVLRQIFGQILQGR